MSIEFVPFEAETLLDWSELTEALLAGHRMPRAEIADTTLYRDPDTLLSRAAWIDGMGMAVKTSSIFPENPAENLPSVNGAVSLFCDDHGTLEAILDFRLVTKWKTAADSLLAAQLLARPGATCVLLIGAGAMARGLREAYGAAFPGARFLVWNRTPGKAEAMASHYPDTLVASDLETAVMSSDIVVSATMAREPLVEGEWLLPGQHLDLVGAYRADMREADDEAIRRSRIFVDSRETVIGQIGELISPMERQIIGEGDVLGDFYDIESGAFARSDDDITLFKNGGGAHLDLITARYILDKWRAR